MKYNTPFIFNASVKDVNGKKTATHVKVVGNVEITKGSFSPSTPRFYAAELARDYGVYCDTDTEFVYPDGLVRKLESGEEKMSGFVMHDSPSFHCITEIQ